MGNGHVADFRSDTVTRPTRRMLEAMVSAQVGDDVLGDDPTVQALEKRFAELFGHEAALFLPSGTMANQCAVAAHIEPGEEVLPRLDDGLGTLGVAWGGLPRARGQHVCERVVPRVGVVARGPGQHLRRPLQEGGVQQGEAPREHRLGQILALPGALQGSEEAGRALLVAPPAVGLVRRGYEPLGAAFLASGGEVLGPLEPAQGGGQIVGQRGATRQGEGDVGHAAAAQSGRHPAAPVGRGLADDRGRGQTQAGGGGPAVLVRGRRARGDPEQGREESLPGGRLPQLLGPPASDLQPELPERRGPRGDVGAQALQERGCPLVGARRGEEQLQHPGGGVHRPGLSARGRGL